MATKERRVVGAIQKCASDSEQERAQDEEAGRGEQGRKCFHSYVEGTTFMVAPRGTGCTWFLHGTISKFTSSFFALSSPHIATSETVLQDDSFLRTRWMPVFREDKKRAFPTAVLCKKIWWTSKNLISRNQGATHHICERPARRPSSGNNWAAASEVHGTCQREVHCNYGIRSQQTLGTQLYASHGTELAKMHLDTSKTTGRICTVSRGCCLDERKGP